MLLMRSHVGWVPLVLRCIFMRPGNKKGFLVIMKHLLNAFKSFSHGFRENGYNSFVTFYKNTE